MLKQTLLGGAKVTAKAAVYGAVLGATFGFGVMTAIKVIDKDNHKPRSRK